MDFITTARSSSNDLIFRNGDLVMVEGKEACRNLIQAAILTQRGEIFLDRGIGIPYFETVFDDPKLIYLWEEAVRQRILKFDFVKDIISFESNIDYNNHILSYKAEIDTTEGLITVSH